MQGKEAGTKRGIDISHYQGNVDFDQLKGNVDFVYIKATEGADYTDPLFSYYVTSAKAHGILCGFYHFARPDQTSADSEAQNFINKIQNFPSDLSPVLDLETPSKSPIDKQTLINWVHEFVSKVEAATGKKLILYTGKWFADIYNDFDGAFAHMPLWISLYGDSVPDFGGWNQWVMWQYSSNGTIAGINGSVDMDIAVSLEAIGYHPPAPKPTLSVEDANYIIHRWIGYEYDYASPDDKVKRHDLANKLRVLSGQPTT